MVSCVRLLLWFCNRFAKEEHIQYKTHTSSVRFFYFANTYRIILWLSFSQFKSQSSAPPLWPHLTLNTSASVRRLHFVHTCWFPNIYIYIFPSEDQIELLKNPIANDIQSRTCAAKISKVSKCVVVCMYMRHVQTEHEPTPSSCSISRWSLKTRSKVVIWAQCH